MFKYPNQSSTKSNPHSLAYRKIKKEIKPNLCHKIKSTHEIKSNPCHKIKSTHEIINQCQKNQEKKGDKGDLGFDIVDSVIVTVTKREEERDEARIMVQQGTKIEREIWWCTPGIMREREREREREQRAKFVRDKEAWIREDKDKCEREREREREHVKEIER